MSYLGRGVDKISNIEKLDNITFNGASSYTLQKGGVNFVPTSAAAILISIDGVVQSGNFTVSSSTIDFGTAVAGTSTCNFIIHLGTGVLTAPSDGSVTTARISDDAVTKAKVNFISDSSSSGVVSKGDGSVDGSISLNCSQNSHHTKISSAAHGAYSGNLNFVLPSSHGSSGQFLKTDGSGNLSFAAAGGITEADQWRLTTNFTGDANPLSSNLERVDTSGWGKLGTGMSESSGIFTFPSTGIWFVKFRVNTVYNGQNRYCTAAIQVTTNNSSYSNVAASDAGMENSSSGNLYQNTLVESLIDCTDTSNVKVRFFIDNEDNSTTVNGSTDVSYTSMMFIRLGDT